MKSPHAPLENSSNRPAPAKEEALRADAARWLRKESTLEMAERHVAEAERRIERQRRLVGALAGNKREGMLWRAQKVLEVLEHSRRLARVHLALERELRNK